MSPNASLNEFTVLREAQALRAQYLRSVIARLFRRGEDAAAERRTGVGATA